jgi:hypothetical protein
VRSKAIVLFLLVGLLLVGCAPGPNDQTGTTGADGEVDGFWDGLWHGIIAPVTFVISLFSDKVSMYDIHNSGNWYNFGFLFGMVIILGGGGSGASSGRKRRG